MKDLIFVLFQAEQYKEALDLAKPFLVIHQKLHGKDDPKALVPKLLVGAIFEAMGQYKEAADYYETVLEKYHVLYGENDSNTIEVLERLSIVYRHLPKHFIESHKLRFDSMDRRLKNNDISVSSALSHAISGKAEDQKHVLKFYTSLFDVFKQRGTSTKRIKAYTKFILSLYRIMGDREVVAGLQDYLEKLEQD